MPLYILVLKRPSDGKIQEWFFEDEDRFNIAKAHAQHADIYISDREDIISDEWEFESWLEEDLNGRSA